MERIQKSRNDVTKSCAMVHGGAQRAVICIAKLLKPALETDLEAPEWRKEPCSDLVCLHAHGSRSRYITIVGTSVRESR